MGIREDATTELAALAATGRLRGRRVVLGAADGELEFDVGRAIDFSSNDYLGLASDARLRDAAIACMTRDGVGATASRLIMTHRAHEELEDALAQWLGSEQVQLFNSGYAANVGLLSTIAGRDDAIFSDELNHASIIDGCRLSRARVVVYRHGALDDLEAALAKTSARRRVVVSETVFSMDGDFAEVAALRAVCDRAGATLVLDEAHAVGLFGPQGRGVAAAQGVTADLTVGTLGKSFGCFGAFVATSSEVATLLWNRARSLVFSTGLPPMVSSAAAAALSIVRSSEGDERRAAVLRNVRALRVGLGLHGAGQIVPWVLGSEERAVRASQQLLAQGIFVQAIRPPTVPPDTARLRIAVGMQSDEAISQLVSALLGLAG